MVDVVRVHGLIRRFDSFSWNQFVRTLILVTEKEVKNVTENYFPIRFKY